MNTVWQNFQAWLASKGGAAHIVAATYLGAVAAYAAVPAFHSVIDSAYNATPPWAHNLLLAAVGLVAWYKDNSSK